MKPFYLLASGIALTMVTACTAEIDSNPFDGNQPAYKTWPDYSEQALSGNVFGRPWTAVTAVSKPTNDKQVVLEFYSETKEKACTSSVSSSKPYATVILPANLTTTEYVADMMNPGSGNPMVFTSAGSSPLNLIAEKTKVRVNSIAGASMNLSVYASGRDMDGTLSEINGKIDVVDCAKAVDFSVWDELTGWYALTDFDGRSASNHTVILENDSRVFYNRTTQKWAKALIVPLIYSVGANSMANYEFGPVEGLGTTSIQEQNGVKTYSYSYHGPVNYKNIDITMTFDMKIVRSGDRLDISYTLEVPSHITKNSHSFSIRR